MSTYPAATEHKDRINRLVIIALVIDIAALPLFLNFALPVYTTSQRGLAWAVFAAGCVPIIHAFRSQRRGVPLMPLLGAQYIVFYALAVFFEDQTKTLDGWIVPAASAVDMTLACVLLSFFAIGIGYTVAARALRLRFQTFRFTPSPQRLFWYALITITGAAAFQLNLFGLAAGGLPHPVSVILSSDLAIAIFACLFYQGELGRWQKVVAVLIVGLSMVMGFAGGMFQNAVQPLLIWVICRWVLRGKAPVGALVLIAVAFFVLQPVKGKYRSLSQASGRTFSTREKISLYTDLIRIQWLGPGLDRTSVLQENRVSAKKRLSLLLATAHYVDWTPYPLDYRNGSTFGYLIYAWIPRAVWPDKPIAQEANKSLPADYNVQTFGNQTSTMFGVGHVAEAYVNFGMVGIFPIFFLLGVLYRVPQLLLERTRTTATIAIFVAVAIAMVGIGSSISDAFGGFLQQIFIQGLLLKIFTSSRVARVRTDGLRPARVMPGFNKGDLGQSLPSISARNR